MGDKWDDLAFQFFGEDEEACDDLAGAIRDELRDDLSGAEMLLEVEAADHGPVEIESLMRKWVAETCESCGYCQRDLCRYQPKPIGVKGVTYNPACRFWTSKAAVNT